MNQMPQIKIYGLRENIEAKRFALSYTIDTALQEAIGTSEETRFQKFITLEPDNFIFPSDRSSNYTQLLKSICLKVVLQQPRKT